MTITRWYALGVALLALAVGLENQAPQGSIAVIGTGVLFYAAVLAITKIDKDY